MSVEKFRLSEIKFYYIGFVLYFDRLKIPKYNNTNKNTFYKHKGMTQSYLSIGLLLFAGLINERIALQANYYYIDTHGK